MRRRGANCRTTEAETMKWLRNLILFDRGEIVRSTDWQAIHSAYVRSIESIDNPVGSGQLKLRRKIQPKTQYFVEAMLEELRNENA